MGERGSGGACPSLAGSMNTLGMVIGFIGVALYGLIVLRAVGKGLFRQFPLFYSYIIYAFGGSLALYMVYWLDPSAYPYAYWIYYLISILVEFAILVEISDQIFRPFPAIRYLGRALTILITAGVGFFYILPTILNSSGRGHAVAGFALRTFVTKAVILAVLFYLARHYGSPLGRNVGGLMLGFSIYVAMNIALMGSAQAFRTALFAHVIWFMEPFATVLCLLMWTISLWEIAPVPVMQAITTAPGRDSRTVAFELTRFNSELSKILHK
jgi:hypothetical protein